MSLTNRYFFDWIESVRTAILYSVKSNCIRFASEYRVQTALQILYQICIVSLTEKRTLSCLASHAKNIRLSKFISCEARDFNSICISWSGRFPLSTFFSPSRLDSRVHYFNFLSNAILKSLFLSFLLFIFLRKVDFRSHWPMKFVISLDSRYQPSNGFNLFFFFRQCVFSYKKG